MLRTQATEMLAHERLQELEEEGTKLAREWACLEAEKARMETVWRVIDAKTRVLEGTERKECRLHSGAAAAFPSKAHNNTEIIDLNIGGHLMSVKRSTLCQVRVVPSDKNGRVEEVYMVC